MTFDDIKRSLQDLDSKQLRELKALVAMLLADSREEVKHDRITSIFELGVLSEIVETMKPYGFASIAMLQGSSGYPAFHDKIGDVEKWFISGGVKELALQKWLVHYAFQVMFGRNRVKGFECSGVGLMANVHRIPQVLDREFPGYAAAGLLPMIRRRKES